LTASALLDARWAGQEPGSRTQSLRLPAELLVNPLRMQRLIARLTRIVRPWLVGRVEERGAK